MDECTNDPKTHHEVRLVNSSGAFDHTIYFRQKRDAKYQKILLFRIDAGSGPQSEIIFVNGCFQSQK